MAWKTTALQMMGQYASTGNYTSSQWDERFNFAAWESTSLDYSYANGYTVTTTGNMSVWSISPDPSTDMDFIRFVVLRTWCNLWNKEIKAKAQNGAYVKNGDDVLDTRNTASNAETMYSKTPCDIFNEEYNKKYHNIHAIYFNFAEETSDD